MKKTNCACKGKLKEKDGYILTHSSKKCFNQISFDDIDESVEQIKGWNKYGTCRWWEHVNWSLLLLVTFILGYVTCMIFVNSPNL